MPVHRGQKSQTNTRSALDFGKMLMDSCNALALGNVEQGEFGVPDSRKAKAMAPDVAEIDYALARSLWASGDEEAALDAMNRAARYLPYLDREIVAVQASINRRP